MAFDLNDPSMCEIVDAFCTESFELLDNLNSILEELDQNTQQVELLADFGQIIDRIMGAAKSISASEIAVFCELGKTIGYKSSQVADENLLNVVIPILQDAVDLLRKMLTAFQQGNSQSLVGLSPTAFVGRLKWLSSKFKTIERSSVAIKTDNQSSIDDLLKSMGL